MTHDETITGATTFSVRRIAASACRTAQDRRGGLHQSLISAPFDGFIRQGACDALSYEERL
jgi:hypothetical protein